MKWYWSAMDIPEFKNLPTSQVRKIFLKHYLQTFRRWSHWIGIFLFLLLIRSLSQWIIVATDNITPFIVRLAIVSISTILFMSISMVFYNEILLNIVANQIRRSNEIK